MSVDRPRLDRIRARLELLACCDPQLQVFGAITHEYRLAPPLAEAEVVEFERRHGVELPADYRAFITTLGNGGAGPFYGLAPLRDAPPKYGAALDEQTPPSLARPFPLAEAWRQGGEPGQPPIPPGTSVYDGVIELSSHGCGYFDVLVVGGPRRGEVWADFTQALGGLVPWYPSFFDAYEAWLDRAFVDWACASPASLLYEDTERFDEALAIVEPLLERALAQLDSPPGDPALLEYPKDPTLLLAALAYLRARQGRHDRALELLDQIPARSNQDGEARRQLGRVRVFADRSELERALEAADAGLASDRLWFATELELLREKRSLLADLERPDEALEVSRKLAQMQASDLFAQYDLAWELLERELLDDAAACLIAAAERGVGCEKDDPLAQRIEQVAGGLLDALEREGLGERAMVLRERLDLARAEGPTD
ncbi:MAG: SMI1/KNR4 family protein [Enhygromyxa sp.]